MKILKYMAACATTLLTPLATAHEGHGVVGSVGHDLQHQFWIVAALIVTGALLLGGEGIAAALQASIATRRKRNEDNDSRK
jgi:hypothetical protein